MFYMYAAGTWTEFITALSRWTTDRDAFRQILSDDKWLNHTFWHRRNLRAELNSISVKFELGTFLENFYIPSFHTSPYLSVVRSKTRIYLSEKDNWYPTETTIALAQQNEISLTAVDKAKDHYFYGAWDAVWELVCGALVLDAYS